MNLKYLGVASLKMGYTRTDDDNEEEEEEG